MTYSTDHNQIPDNGHRMKVEYRGDNLYFIHIKNADGTIKEIDLNQTTSVHDHKETVSGLAMTQELVNALISLGAFDKVIEITRRTSLGRKTLPGIIYAELAQYINK